MLIAVENKPINKDKTEKNEMIIICFEYLSSHSVEITY